MNAASQIENDFLGLIDRNRQRILRICRVYAWSPPDQEDLYQEILFQTWRALPGLKEKAHANTWLYRVALNTAISSIRKQRPEKHLVSNDSGEACNHFERDQSSSQSADARLDSLYGAIARLNALEKALITLFLEDMNYEQIGEIMGLKPNHVGVMLHRIKKKLTCLLKEAMS